MNITKNLNDYITSEIDYWDFSGVIRVVQNGKTLFVRPAAVIPILRLASRMTWQRALPPPPLPNSLPHLRSCCCMTVDSCSFTKRQTGTCPPICSCLQTSLSTICYLTHPDCTTITTLRMIFMCTRTESLMIRRDFSKNGF